MIKRLQNIEYNSFLEAIVQNCSTSIGQFSSFEIISDGLKVYKSISNCNTATLFYINQDNFEFYFKTSTALEQEAKIREIFDSLIEEGKVGEALNTLEIVVCTSYIVDEKANSILLIPLTTYNGIVGLCLLTLIDKVENNTDLYSIIKLYSNSFAFKIENVRLSLENEDLKNNTEQKIASRTKDIAQSTRELKTILDTVQTGIIIIDQSNDIITDANKLAVEIIGTTKEDIIGTKRSHYFFLGDRQLSREKIKTQNDVLLKKNDGSLLPIIKTTAEVTFNQNKFDIVSFVDISEQKKIQEELQKARYELELRVEERTQELSETNKALQKEIAERIKAEQDIIKLYWALHQSPVAIMITDLEAKTEYINPQFTQTTGFTYEDVIGQNPRFLASGDLSKKDYEKMWNTFLTQDEWRGEIRNKKKNGDLFWAAVTISTIRNNEGEVTHYLGTQVDITEKVNAVNDLIKAKERAEESDKLKTHILANMNHEFRTPLIGILGFSQLLQTTCEDEENKELVDSIYHSGMRLLKTSNSILELSQIQSDIQAITITNLNLLEAIQNSVEKYLTEIHNKKLKLYIPQNDNTLFVKADLQLFEDSIGNLIDNAVRFTESGSITITTGKISVDNIDYITIEIKDTGIGIDKESFPVIFEAFRQASEGFSRSYEGCGLGLTLAQKYVELMHGKITVESKVGEGSIFCVWLPAA